MRVNRFAVILFSLLALGLLPWLAVWFHRHPELTSSAQGQHILYFALPIFVSLLLLSALVVHRLLLRPLAQLTNAVERKAEGEDIDFRPLGGVSQIRRLRHALTKVFDEERRAKEQIQNLAYYDTLTGLANRRLFKIYLDNAIATAKRDGQKLALLFIDLDNFKVINDHYGHQMGDRVLAEFANRVQRITRSSDMVSAINPTESTNIARLAGDEFAILLSGLDDTIATVAVAERLLESTHQPVEIDNKLLYVQASIGIATYPDDAQNSDQLIRHADAAMYQAKTSGKHTYHFFSKTLSKILQRQRQVQEALRSALLNNEFYLELQPYVHAKDFTLAGVELLLRWQSHSLGKVSPAEFVPIAESCGVMREIDAWVISACCEMLSDWRERGLSTVPCSVNISAGELRNQSLPTFIDACLKSYNLSPSDLEIEITETKLVDHDDRSMAVLERLNVLGLTIALDDFGRGFTSLNQLKAYPVQRLKIDKTFIAELDGKESTFKIADVILMLSHSYGLAATAEGVENLEQARYLSASGCTFLQGFYFSRPISRAAFEHVLSRGRITLPLPVAPVTPIGSNQTFRPAR
ncbi:putative bifunctional diguanylate cyclase/phosphodiesterase [Porticoccus sp.]